MKKEHAMTTVINFNILNFVRLRQNVITVNNDVRSYDRYPESRTQNLDQVQEQTGDVIDITPYNPALIGTQHAHQARMSKEVSLFRPSRGENIYNRNGKTIQWSDAKGLLIDSYA